MNKYKPSLTISRLVLVLFSALLMFWPSSLRADSVRQMNLAEMCKRAGKIFRGTVVAAIPGTVQVGGGELPIVTYRIRVDDSFKGEVQTVKNLRFVEVRMLAPQLLKKAGQSNITTFFSGIPQLVVGREYLLLTTRPSPVGLSTTVGLGQGLFQIKGEGERAEAVNEFGNNMLFNGMETTATQSKKDPNQPSVISPAARPLRYSQLAEQIRRLVREGGTR